MVTDRSIRIESRIGQKGGNFIYIVDAESGKLLTNIKAITIFVVTDDVVVADVMCGDNEPERHYVGKIDVTILSEEVKQ